MCSKLCLLRARCLQQTGMQLGNAARGYNEHLRERGWSLSVSRNDITHRALIYFPLQKVHVVGFAPQAASAAVVAVPWDAAAQCTTFDLVFHLQGPSPGCPHLATISMTLPWAMNHRAPLKAGRRKGEMTGTVARERGCLRAVAALHPSTSSGQGLLPIKQGFY